MKLLERERLQMTIYMEITQDKYSLPVRVCDSVSELARLTGLTPNNISSQISKGKQGKYQFPRFISVFVK